MSDDHHSMRRCIELGLQAERLGNLPIGALITLDGEVIAEGASAILVPTFHPGRHAEAEALRRVPDSLWRRRRGMTCYTTLEPCVMCFGSLLLHGLGRIVFGAHDPEGGAGVLLAHLPRYYAHAESVPLWEGPLMPEICDALYLRAANVFSPIDRADGL